MEPKAPSFRNLTRHDYGQPEGQQNQLLQNAVLPHIESFNYVLEEGLSQAVGNMSPVEFLLNDERVSLSLEEASIGIPTTVHGNIYASNLKVYPSECRQRGITYQAPIQTRLSWHSSKGESGAMQVGLGSIPLMVKCKNCNLHNLSPSELIKRREDSTEMGGYFITNGIERVIRMLIMPRRNFPMAINRPRWKTRGKAFTEFGVSMRCVRNDQSIANITLHYLTTGNIVMSFSFNRQMFFIPLMLILKALIDTSDQHVYDELVRGKEDDTFLIGCVTGMLRHIQTLNLSTQQAALQYIGQLFRVKLYLPPWYSEEQVAKFLLQQCICVHLTSNQDKFNVLTFMTRKLFAFTQGECAAENADSPMNQEVLLAGHLYLMVLKEKLESWLLNLRFILEKKAKDAHRFVFSEASVSMAVRNAGDLTRKMEYLIATGNVASKTGLGLMQASGMTVVADKLNFMRFLSHFRCIHRGAFFAEMRTTSVRKLLPEAWGFLCPVHTPDGAPCGLMNHLTASCQVVNTQPMVVPVARALYDLGMTPLDGPLPCRPSECYVVVLDGRVLGYLPHDIAAQVTSRMKTLKVKEENGVSSTTEIVLVQSNGKLGGQYPGLYIFTTPARLMRPVRNLALKTTEMIGTFEQVYMDIAVTPSEAHEKTTHLELGEGSILSIAASLTPFSDFNQSPRNMYQCQMGKQTMGFPSHTLPFRADHKMYKLQTPQAPVVRPHTYDKYEFDNFPLGTNAVVAVISYTGYDMEDAMIINKAGLERGFAHASIYKTEEIDLKQKTGDKRSAVPAVFGCNVDDPRVKGQLDQDGFPPVGTVLQQGDPFYAYIKTDSNQTFVERYRGSEVAVVDHIKLTGNDLGNQVCQKAFIQLRIQRNPIIGDKFSSRHGQKGICSQRWPQEDMPFTESGMTPDIIFNPHGFPSRMTIGMMIESMAGKSGALHGLCHDATPFTFSEDKPAVDYFGKLLTAGGYNYYGTERMYSGTSGVELEADIFIGVVYYQRLRHMVSDKFQVRSTGPVDILTHQPVKGRKRAGGIRFGEMERDSLLAHGTSFLLQDRLLNCSDKSLTRVCTKCGMLLGIHLEKQSQKTRDEKPDLQDLLTSGHRKWVCATCDSSDHIEPVTVPYVFQYLVAELSAMNIKVTLGVK
ncbi:DNA-directed RNA polymerase I subunit RPA2-like [Diadema antillarum]|uniref:DNA-directed RNA polymerase I subunit RPA2-like n=1 Tax=Diadema antillarum TaxID=105358 RepID=UPI003A884A85